MMSLRNYFLKTLQKKKKEDKMEDEIESIMFT